jgi:DNA-binding response OmpR family regulator
MRVLLLEDDPFLKFDLADMVTSMGHEVLGPFQEEEAATRAVIETGCDAAILDFNLGGGRDSAGVGDLLLKHDVPFAFTTGHSREYLPDRFASVNVIEKPYRDHDIKDFVSRATRQSSDAR